MPTLAVLRCRVLPAAARDEAGALWRALEPRVGEPALACSWAWTATWLGVYGDVVEHRFVVGERDGEPCGIALITRGPARRGRPRTLHVGTAGEPVGETVFVERNRLCCAPADRAAFAAALLDALEAERGWDRLRLDGMLPADADALLAERPGARVRTDLSPIADLGAGDDVLDGLSSGRRGRIRRTLRAFGPLELDWAASAAEAAPILEELIALHRASWARRGEEGAFGPRTTRFHRALVQRLVPTGGAALVRVRRGEETVGCLYGLIEGRRLLFYQGGLRHYADNKLRPGQAAHVMFMRACRERGLERYDFLAPTARYKEELATGAEELVWAELERPGLRTTAARLHRRLERAS